MAEFETVTTNIINGMKEMPESVTPQPKNEAQARQQAEEQQIAEMQRVIRYRIAELKLKVGSPIPPEIAAQIQDMESAVVSGDLRTLNLVYTATVTTSEQISEVKADQASDFALQVAIFDSYQLSEFEARRAYGLCQRVDINDPASLLRFTEAMVDQAMPEALRNEQAAQLVVAMSNNPAQVAAMNAANPEARAETMAAYVAAQRDFDLLEKDPKYASIADTLKRADKMGLEALPEVQELLRRAKEGTLSPEDLQAKFEPLIEAQKQKYIAEMTDARAQQSPEMQAILANIGQGEEKGSNKAIYQLARATIAHLKENPAYQMSEQEHAALNTFALTKDKAIFKILGDDALAKTFELGTGTIEQRTDRALQAVKEHMPPELRGMKEEVLRERIKQSLINADEHHVAVKNLDTLNGQALASLSAEIGTDMRAALEKSRFLEANGVNPAEAAVAGKNNAQIDAETSDFLKEFNAKKLAQTGENPQTASVVASNDAVPTSNAGDNISAVVASTVSPLPAGYPKDLPSLSALGVTGGATVVENGTPTGGKQPQVSAGIATNY